jgi:hypothetical protein
MPNLDQLAAGVVSDVQQKAKPNAKKTNGGEVTTRAADEDMADRNWNPTIVQGRDGIPRVDVMNKLNPPNVGTTEDPLYNIENPSWEESDWRFNSIALDLPPTSKIKPISTGNPCLDGCQERASQIETKCEILRQRVTDALMKSGCPTAYYALKKVENAGGCTSYVLANNQPNNQTTSTTMNPQYTPQTNPYYYAGTFQQPQSAYPQQPTYQQPPVYQQPVYQRPPGM